MISMCNIQCMRYDFYLWGCVEVVGAPVSVLVNHFYNLLDLNSYVLEESVIETPPVENYC